MIQSKRWTIGWIHLKSFTNSILLFQQNHTIISFLKRVYIYQLDHHQVSLIKKMKNMLFQCNHTTVILKYYFNTIDTKN